MDGGAADPAILERRCQSPPRLLPQRHGPWEMASLPIPDELLPEIFLRLPTPADLVRASAGCVSFRRVVADRSFLRRYRKLHAPPLLGFLDVYRVFHPAEPPHPSASAAHAVALAADFSFSFLPAPAPDRWWGVGDIRDSRVLIQSVYMGFHSEEIAVCDPLHRRYILLPPIPHDLAAMVRNPCSSEAFLIPRRDGDDDEEAAAEETLFKVMCMVQCEANLIAFVFSSSTRQWQAAASHSWSNLLAGLPSLIEERLFSRRQYAYGCFYWLSHREYEMKMLVLDSQRMEFCIADPPSEAKDTSSLDVAMVEAGGEGRPGMLVCGQDTPDCVYTIWRNNGKSSSQWQKEKIISHSLGSQYALDCSMEKYLILDHFGGSSLEPGRCMFDIETLQLERVCASIVLGFAYCNYPPSLSSPTVSSGIEEEVLEQGMEARQAEGPIDGHQDNDVDAEGQDDVLRIGDGAD